MRLPRSPLLRRLTGPDLPSVVLLEAPPGYGKSWLVRRAAGQDVLRLRGELGPLATSAEPPPSRRHRRRPPAVAGRRRPARRAHRGRRRRAAVDDRRPHPRRRGPRGGPPRRRTDHRRRRRWPSTPEEVADQLPDQSMTLARRIVDAADGSVRVIATSLDQTQRDPSADPIAVVSRMVRVASAAAAATARRPRAGRRRPSSPGHPASTATSSTSSAAPGSSIGRSPPASRCAVRSPAPSTWPRRRRSERRPSIRRQPPSSPASCSSAGGRWRPSGCCSTPASTSGRRT